MILLIDFAEVSITTPALLFSAAAFLLLSFTNRYITLSSRIRTLCDDYLEKPKPNTLRQIKVLDRRVDFLRFMQVIIILSLFAAVLSMFLIFLKSHFWGVIAFGLSLLLLCASLLATIYEINISSHALKINIAETLKSVGTSFETPYRDKKVDKYRNE
jgi:hypothetical protein